MTITITQTCDGCGATRELKSTGQADYEGWRLVTGLRHLCSVCIRKALKAYKDE